MWVLSKENRYLLSCSTFWNLSNLCKDRIETIYLPVVPSGFPLYSKSNYFWNDVSPKGQREWKTRQQKQNIGGERNIRL